LSWLSSNPKFSARYSRITIALASLGYHDYEGIAVSDAEKPRLVRDLGDNACLILRNHGLLAVGDTVSDAFLRIYNLQRACEIQVLAQAGGTPLTVDPRILSGVKQNVATVTRGMAGSLVWPGLLRKLDRVNPGYAD
jgi:ribulose-5-phosphate 4-epimerase/fuculose-1-phosphate aldolase